MKIRVELLAQLRDAAGAPVLEVDCDVPCTVRQLVRRLADEHGPAFGALALDGDERLAPSLLVALGGRQLRPHEDPELSDADTLLLATPIAGG